MPYLDHFLCTGRESRNICLSCGWCSDISKLWGPAHWCRCAQENTFTALSAFVLFKSRVHIFVSFQSFLCSVRYENKLIARCAEIRRNKFKRNLATRRRIYLIFVEKEHGCCQVRSRTRRYVNQGSKNIPKRSMSHLFVLQDYTFDSLLIQCVRNR